MESMEMNSTETKSLSTDLGVPYVIVSSLTLMTNFVVIFVIAKFEERHIPTLWVICHMAVWDFLNGLRILLISVPFAFYENWPFSNITKIFASSISLFIPAQNVLNVATVTVDRFIAVRFPFAYPRIATKRNYGIAVVGTIFLNMIRLLMIIFPKGRFFCDPVYASCYIIFNSLHGTLASMIVILGSFFIIIVCSSVMIWDSKKTNHVTPQEANGRVVSKLTLMSLLNAAVFCMSYLPICVNVLVSFFVDMKSLPAPALKFAQLMLISSSIWNVVIYTATFQQFREMLTRIFCKAYYLRKRRRIQQVPVTTGAALNQNRG